MVVGKRLVLLDAEHPVLFTVLPRSLVIRNSKKMLLRTAQNNKRGVSATGHSSGKLWRFMAFLYSKMPFDVLSTFAHKGRKKRAGSSRGITRTDHRGRPCEQ